MAIILRVDVDKPYGKHNIFRKIASKVKEDYLPRWSLYPGYLSHLKEFIIFCNENGIRGTFYHRLCTVPDPETLNLLNGGNHQIGLHLENSRDISTFIGELKEMEQLLPTIDIDTFSKHGSGVHKLGKFHYPLYEPEKYQEWSKSVNIAFPSGNGIPSCSTELDPDDNGYYQNVFWVEPPYRSASYNDLDLVLEKSLVSDIVVLIHPCNYAADKKTRDDFHKIAKFAKENAIEVKPFPSIYSI